MWQHPWLRVQLLLRSMFGTRWEGETWPTIKAELRKALPDPEHGRRRR